MNIAALTLIAFLFLFTSCNYKKNGQQPHSLVLPSPYPQLENAHWLLGVWQHNTAAGDATEYWSSLDDSTYAGFRKPCA